MQQILDIVDLIKNNPINNFNREYQNKFIEKIKNNFNNDEQNLFIASFYGYLNYDSKKDYVIDLNDIWKWLGFARKDFCKVVLEKHFEHEKDYKIDLLQPKENSKGGRPKEIILMNIKTFKKLCLKSCTKKADDIHDYFIKLEEIFHEIINEESNELKEQLKLKDKELVKKETEALKNNEKYLLKEFHEKKVVYIIKIEDDIYKYGCTNSISRRLKEHHTLYGHDIILIYCIESKDQKTLESLIKEYLNTTEYKYEKEYNKVLHRELILLERIDIQIFIDKIVELNKSNLDISINKEISNLRLKIVKLEEELKKYKELEDVNKNLNEQNVNLKEELKKYKNINIVDLEAKIIKQESELEEYRNTETDIVEHKTYYNFIDSFLCYKKDNQVLLKDVLNKFNQEYYKTNFAKINIQEKKKMENELIECITNKFCGNVFYKDGGTKPNDFSRKRFINLVFNDTSTFYTDEIYNNFINKYIEIKDRKRTPNEGYLFKERVSDIIYIFEQYVNEKDIKNLYLKKGGENLRKKELRENICKYTNSKIMKCTFGEQIVNAFVGIKLKSNNN